MTCTRPKPNTANPITSNPITDLVHEAANRLDAAIELYRAGCPGQSLPPDHPLTKAEVALIEVGQTIAKAEIRLQERMECIKAIKSGSMYGESAVRAGVSRAITRILEMPRP